MIIVTGPDNSGKSTLVGRLVRDFKLEKAQRYHTLPPADGESYFQYWKVWLERDQLGEAKNVIHDRGIIDEFVYGFTLRGKLCLTTSQVSTIRDKLYVAQPLIILCQPPIDVQLKTFHERPQLKNTDVQIDAINNAFDYMLTEYPLGFLKVVKYDYTKNPEAYENVTSQVQTFLNY
jgi:GTPase SAR1 family protein